jgi:hypothetical protein
MQALQEWLQEKGGIAAADLEQARRAWQRFQRTR